MWRSEIDREPTTIDLAGTQRDTLLRNYSVSVSVILCATVVSLSFTMRTTHMDPFDSERKATRRAAAF